MTLKTSCGAALGALLLLSIAPAASAEGLPDTSDMTGSTGGVTDTVGGTVGDTTGGVTDTVGGTVGDTTGGVTDTVGGTTGGVADTVGGTVGDTTGSVTDTVDETTGGGGGGNVTDPVTETVNDVTGGGSGSGVDELLDGGGSSPGLDQLTPDLIADVVDEGAAAGMSPAAAEGWIEATKVPSTYDDATIVLASLSGLLEDFAGAVFGTTTSASGSDLELVSNEFDRSFFDSAGRAAVAAAKALAFPAALALLVVVFLVAQARFGRKDPKLVLAPVDTTQESLSFE